jgi:hypothetical protein
MPSNPLPNPQDRAERDIEELRRLFAGSGKRTRRFDEIVAAAERRLASAEDDAGATAEAAPGVPPHRVRPAPDDQAVDQAVEVEPAPTPPPASPAATPGAGPAADQRRPALPSGRRGLAVLLATTAVVGVVVSFAVGLRLGQAQASPEPAARAPAPPAAQSSVVTGQAATTVSTVVTAPPACLATARLGDRVIDLLVANRRGPELDRALDGYLAASRGCRRAAAPGP